MIIPEGLCVNRTPVSTLFTFCQPAPPDLKVSQEMSPGFISISMVLLVFGYLIAKIMKQSYLSKDRFSSLALIGFATILMSHVFVNTAMTVGLIPVKGLPLPFISAGGSFLISSYLMFGLILKLSVNYSD